MKKIYKIIFYCLIASLSVACVIHTVIAYVNIGRDKFTSCPAEVAFLLIIPYAAAILVCVAVWLIIKHKNSEK